MSIKESNHWSCSALLKNFGLIICILHLNIFRKIKYKVCIFIGLCGDTALLDIGGIWNLFPFPIKDKIIYFQSILEKLDRTQSDNLIIGGGLRTERPTNLLGEVCIAYISMKH